MSWIHALRERLVNLLVDRDAEIDEEIRHHLALETERHRAAGADPKIARARALARFGEPRRFTEATRDERGRRFMEGRMQDLKWAVRSLRKNVAFTALALFTLTLGIGATTTAFTVVDTVLLRPLPYPDPDRLVVLEELGHDQVVRYPSYPNFDDWRSQTRSFERVASIQPRFFRVTGSDGEALRVAGLGISRGFFEMLRVAPFLGRTFADEENQVGGASVVMVSYEFWKTHLGQNPSLGIVHLGTDPYRVVGVAPPDFQFMATYDLFFPHERGPGTVRSAHYLTVVARLAPHASVQSARTEMTTLSHRLFAAFGNATQAEDARITPLQEYFVGGYRNVVRLVFAAATLVLLVACTNMISAQLARGLTRGREIAIRAALGASRRRLIAELLIESSVLAVIGTALGSALALLLVRLVRSVGAGLMPRLSELSVNAHMLAFSGGIALIVVILIGVYPALRLVRSDAANTLRGAARSSAPQVRAGIWRLLVGVEMALAVVLIAASLLLVRTLHNILTNDVGFEIHGVVTAALSSGDTKGSRLEELRTDLAALPGVSGVAYSNQFPMDWGNWSAPLLRPTDPPDHDWPALAGFRAVTSNYFDVLRLPIVRGRGFTDEDRVGTPLVAIVTTGVAERLWPGENPLGKLVRSNQEAKHLLTIVGIVSEARSWTMSRGSQNEIYVPRLQHEDWLTDPIALVRTTGSPTAAIADVTQLLHATARDIPARVGLLEDRVARTAASRRFAMFAIVAFGLIAVLLAAIGIYGVLAYTVTSQRFEIGVRMALGATSRSILQRTLGGAAAMSLGGIGVGIGAGLVATQYLKSLLYGVSPFEPLAYLAGASMLLVVALLGAFVPARRASRVDPLLAIRGEA